MLNWRFSWVLHSPYKCIAKLKSLVYPRAAVCDLIIQCVLRPVL